MISLNIQDIEPGMVLGSEVKDRTGRVLLNQGTIITEKHLSIFRMWGIADAMIENADWGKIEAKAVALIDPAALQQAQEETERLLRFLQPPTHPFVLELKRLSAIRFAAQKEAAGL